MKLSRKESRNPLPGSHDVAVVHAPGDRIPEGKIPIDIRIVQTCFLSLHHRETLVELCRSIGFQPAGFRLDKMSPPDLISQFIRHVQRQGLGEAPLIGLIDDSALEVAEFDPLTFKSDILSPPDSRTMMDPEAECWAAATWIKVRTGSLDARQTEEIARICDAWMHQPVLNPSALESLLLDPKEKEASEKAKKKIADWRGRALGAEKELESTRSAKITFERELKQAKDEIRSLREEGARLQKEIGGRTAAQEQLESKVGRLQSELKAANAKIAKLESSQEEGRKTAASSEKVPASRPVENSPALEEMKSKIERLQRSIDRLSLRLDGNPRIAGTRTASFGGSERTIAFIDVANIDWGAKTYFGRRIDYEKLDRYLRSRTPTGHARTCSNVAFLCTDREGGSEDFAQALRLMGYRTVTRPLKVYPDGTTKGNVDVELAVFAMGNAADLDTAVIVSGDGDFACLAQYFKSYGKRVEVVSFENLGVELRRVADEVVLLDERVLLPETQRRLDWK